MPEKYILANEPDKTMFVFKRGTKVYGHIVKNKVGAAPAKFVFETPTYETVAQLKADYPEATSV